MKKKVITTSVTAEHLNTSEVKFIKIPTDFQSLHDLKELIGNYNLVTRLTTVLNDYNHHYVNSFLLNMDEVLTFIPEEQHKDYKLSYREDYRDLNKSYEYKAHDSEYNDCGWRKNKEGKEEYYTNGMKTKHVSATEYAYLLPKNVKSGDAKLPLDIALNKLFKHDTYSSKSKLLSKHSKMFMVDTINKIVEICPYFLLKNKNEDICYNFNRVSYTGAIDFGLDENNNLLLKVHYIIHDRQARGGVWINGRSGYLSGEKYVDYTRNGCDHYAFCTRTNKFLGYIESIEDRRRGWNE